MADPAGGGTDGARRAGLAAAGRAGELDVVLAALDDPAAAIRRSAIDALARAGALDAAAFARARADPDPVVRRELCELAPLLSGFDFVPLLEDREPSVVEAAAFACGETGDPGAVDGLVAIATGHPDALCREAAVAALGAIGDERGLAAVLAALRDVPAVRRRGTIALANFEGDDVDRALLAAREDRDWQVRQAAEDLLGVNRTPRR